MVSTSNLGSWNGHWLGYRPCDISQWIWFHISTMADGPFNPWSSTPLGPSSDWPSGDLRIKRWGINGHSRNLNWRYLPYIMPIFQAYVREYPHKIWPYMVQYLHFRILKFPLIVLDQVWWLRPIWLWIQSPISGLTSSCSELLFPAFLIKGFDPN